jgi:hypothetical protein
VPSGPDLGAITSAGIADDGSNSGWNVVGPSKESITRTAGGAGVGGGQADATLRALAASAVNTEIGFETTQGTSHPGSRASTRYTPGPGTAASIARSASAIGRPSRSNVRCARSGRRPPTRSRSPGSGGTTSPIDQGIRAGSGPPPAVKEKPSAGASASRATKLRPSASARTIAGPSTPASPVRGRLRRT